MVTTTIWEQMSFIDWALYTALIVSIVFLTRSFPSATVLGLLSALVGLIQIDASMLFYTLWVGLIIVWAICATLFERDENLICAWCKSHELEFEWGEEYLKHWLHSNKDGSRDKRMKENHQQAFVRSRYKCKKCTATTNFLHALSDNPTVAVPVIARAMEDHGNGKRVGTDWEKNLDVKSLDWKIKKKKHQSLDWKV